MDNYISASQQAIKKVHVYSVYSVLECVYSVNSVLECVYSVNSVLECVYSVYQG